MPLTVFDCKGISATRRVRIEAAVEAAGNHIAQPYEGWIAADPFQGGVHALITGPQGFERAVTFAFDEAPATITERVRETIEDWRRRALPKPPLPLPLPRRKELLHLSDYLQGLHLQRLGQRRRSRMLTYDLSIPAITLSCTWETGPAKTPPIQKRTA
jgi:hypothetical protein